MQSCGKNATVSVGNIVMLDKVENDFGLFKNLLNGLYDRSSDFKQIVKLLVYNKGAECVAVNRLTGVYSKETFELLGFKEVPAERNIYRAVERLGKNYSIVHAQFQKFVVENNLVADKQFLDFSSTFFEGKGGSLGKLGYSRDHEPGKKQLTFGIATGINGVPTALTIQAGNVQDKAHFRTLVNVSNKVIPKNSALIFDCGGNTIENKALVRSKNFQYLTLRPKHQKAYKKLIQQFEKAKSENTIIALKINGGEYECFKTFDGDEWKYIFFNQRLKDLQLEAKRKKFEKTLKSNDSKLKLVKNGKDLGELPTSEGFLMLNGHLQKTFEEISNVFITGLEGFFILESSIDADSERILCLYKDKDKVEKFIRDLKEGLELRPVRHWSDNAIIGCILIAFLTKVVFALTLKFAENPLVNNAKLLKKYLNNLTLTFAYPENAFRFTILANVSDVILGLFGDFIKKYEDKSLQLRW